MKAKNWLLIIHSLAANTGLEIAVNEDITLEWRMDW
jgi:hypothetical protein